MKKTSLMKFFPWLSLAAAADYLHVSADTIGRRAIPWPRDNQLVQDKIRYKVLDLGSTKKPRRYSMEDLRALKEKKLKKLGGGEN